MIEFVFTWLSEKNQVCCNREKDEIILLSDFLLGENKVSSFSSMVKGMQFLSYESKKVSILILSRKMFTEIIPSKSVLGN